MMMIFIPCGDCDEFLFFIHKLGLILEIRIKFQKVFYCCFYKIYFTPKSHNTTIIDRDH